MMGMGEKPRNLQKAKTKENIPRLVALLSSRLRKMETDCFPVSENTENKPDLPRWDGGPNLAGQRNTGLGAEWVDKSR